MPAFIRVELPDAQSATSLTQELFGRFHVELVSRDDAWYVEMPASRATTQLLTAVERWLDLYGLDEVTVHLDGTAHTLQRSTARK